MAQHIFEITLVDKGGLHTRWGRFCVPLTDFNAISIAQAITTHNGVKLIAVLKTYTSELTYETIAEILPVKGVIEKKGQSLKQASFKAKIGFVQLLTLGNAQANNMGAYRTRDTSGKELGKKKKGGKLMEVQGDYSEDVK